MCPSKSDMIEVNGVIEESLPNAQFRVKLETGQVIMAHISGKIRKHYIRVLLGVIFRSFYPSYKVLSWFLV